MAQTEGSSVSDGPSLLDRIVSKSAEVIAKTPHLESAFSVDAEPSLLHSDEFNFVEKGDIILSQTGGAFYSLIRTLTGQNYDHCAVVLSDGKRALHVSPPTVRTLPVSQLFHNRDERSKNVTPMVLRPRFFNEQHKLEFLMQCESMVGQSYDFVRLVDLILRMTALTWFDLLIPFNSSEMQHYLKNDHSSNSSNQNNQKRRVICTEALLSLVNSSFTTKDKSAQNDDDQNDNNSKSNLWQTLFEHSLLKDRLDLQKVGSVTFTDIETVSRLRPDLLVRVSLPKSLRMSDDSYDRYNTNHKKDSPSTLEIALDLMKGMLHGMPHTIQAITDKFKRAFNELDGLQKVLILILVFLFIRQQVSYRKTISSKL